MGVLPNFQFRPTVIPKDRSLVLNQFGQTADALDKRYDEQLDFANKLSILSANTQVGEGDRGIKDAAIKRISDTIGRIQDEDIGFENASLILSKEARDFAKDEDLQHAQRQFMLQEEARKREDVLRSEGRLSFPSDPAGFQSVTRDEEGNKVFNVFKPTGEETKDHFGDALKHFGTLKSDIEAIAPSLVNVPGGVLRLLQQGSIEEIADPDIRKRVNQVIDQFMDSSTGGNQFKRIKEAELRKAFPNATDEEIELGVRDEAKQLLLAAGQNQTVRRERIGFQQSQEDALRLRASLAATKPDKAFNTRGIASVLPNANATLDKVYKVNSNGDLVMGQTDLKFQAKVDDIDKMLSDPNVKRPKVQTPFGLHDVSDHALIIARSIAKLQKFFSSEGDISLESTEEGRRIKDILTKSGDISEGMSNSEVKEAVRGYTEDFMNSYVNPEANAVQGLTLPTNKDVQVAQDKADKFFFNSDKDGVPAKNSAAINLKFTSASPGASDAGAEFTGTELLKKINDDNGTLSVLGDLGNDNPYYPGARQVVDGDGNVYYMQGSSEEERANKLEWNFYQARYHPTLMHKFKDGNRSITIKQNDNDVTMEYDGNIVRASSYVDLINDYYNTKLQERNATSQ